MTDIRVEDGEGLLRATDLTFLLGHGVTAADLLAADMDARRQGVGTDAALMAGGYMEADAFYRALASHCGQAFLAAPQVIVTDRAATVLAAGVAPLRPGQQARWVAAPTGLRIRPLLALAAGGRRADGFALTTPARFERAVLVDGGGSLAAGAANALADGAPGRSFRDEASRGEIRLALLLVFLASFWIGYWGLPGLFDVAAALCCVVAVNIVVRLAATVESPSPRLPPVPHEVRLPDRSLPTYSVLVALHREATVVPALCASLARLDYPPAKLEVLFLVEHDDLSTRAALERHLLPETQRIVVCPPGLPRTKPRALNIGLALARGELLVIFDAEDEPASDQLRLAAARFAVAGPRLASIQAVLSIHNDADSVFARLCRLEYAALFAVILPGLARMGLPIPLGGTSNHFRRTALNAAGGWDAWNVTEDADLGLRLASLGYEVSVLSSETAEEAPATFVGWFFQRTRWLKGWIQTSIVASRTGMASRQADPFASVVIFGHGWCTVLTALAGPATILSLGFGLIRETGSIKDTAQLSLGLVVLVAGLAALIWPIVVGAARARIRLSPVDLLLFVPYVLLISAAAWAALWEMVVAPHRWNKTTHGLAGAAGGSEHRLEFPRGLSRRTLEVEAADEAPALVYQVDQRGVIHGVAAAVERNLAGVDAPRLEHRLDRRTVTTQGPDA